MRNETILTAADATGGDKTLNITKRNRNFINNMRLLLRIVI